MTSIFFIFGFLHLGSWICLSFWRRLSCPPFLLIWIQILISWWYSLQKTKLSRYFKLKSSIWENAVYVLLQNGGDTDAGISEVPIRIAKPSPKKSENLDLTGSPLKCSFDLNEDFDESLVISPKLKSKSSSYVPMSRSEAR